MTLRILGCLDRSFPYTNYSDGIVKNHNKNIPKINNVLIFSRSHCLQFGFWYCYCYEWRRWKTSAKFLNKFCGNYNENYQLDHPFGSCWGLFPSGRRSYWNERCSRKLWEIGLVFCHCHSWIKYSWTFAFTNFVQCYYKITTISFYQKYEQSIGHCFWYIIFFSYITSDNR